MKNIFLIVLLFAVSLTVNARSQRGYMKKNGTYVSPHQKASPDGKRWNNRGSRTNGGRQRDEFSSPPAYNKRRY